MSGVRNIRYTEDTLITDARITPAPRTGQTVSGYGRSIPTMYELRYEGRWHRVYMMCYSNVGTAYIKHRGEDLVLSIHAEHEVERMVERGRSTDPRKESTP